MLETEHKHHILTPLLWPSRCLSCSLRCWGLLHRGFPRAPSVGCGLPYHISSLTLCESAGNCIGGFPSAPSVGCGLPYHICSLLSGSLLATASGIFRVPPRSGVAFPTTSGLYCLEVCWQLLRGFPSAPSVGCGLPYHIWSLWCLDLSWQLHRGFPRSPSVGCGLPYHISSLTLRESAGNCMGGFRGPHPSSVAFPTTSRL